MRIDTTSLIAAQSIHRPAPAAPKAAPQAAADKPLFEPLNFPKSEPAASAKPPAAIQPAAPRRLGSQLDITV